MKLTFCQLVCHKALVKNKEDLLKYEIFVRNIKQQLSIENILEALYKIRPVDVNKDVNPNPSTLNYLNRPEVMKLEANMLHQHVSASNKIKRDKMEEANR